MVLDSVSTYDYSHLENFGYKTLFTENKLKIGFLFNSLETGSNLLQINDQVLQIDSADYSNITQDEYCQVILDTTKNGLREQSITILRDSIQITIPLTQAIILK